MPPECCFYQPSSSSDNNFFATIGPCLLSLDHMPGNLTGAPRMPSPLLAETLPPLSPTPCRGPHCCSQWICQGPPLGYCLAAMPPPSSPERPLLAGVAIVAAPEWPDRAWKPIIRVTFFNVLHKCHHYHRTISFHYCICWHQWRHYWSQCRHHLRYQDLPFSQPHGRGSLSLLLRPSITVETMMLIVSLCWHRLLYRETIQNHQSDAHS